MKLFNELKFGIRLLLSGILFLCLMTPGVRVNAATQNEGIDRGIHDKLIEPAIPNKELRRAEKFWEDIDRFILIGNVQAYGTFSELQGDDLWGGSFYGLVAPAVKISERMMFIFMYDGQYDRRRELYSDSYGFRKRTEFQRHAFTPMLRIDFGEGSRYSITPSINYTATWNKDEGDDDSWDQGLYNYRDEGVGLDFDMRQCMGEHGTLVIGLQYYQRRYPNFDVTLFIADPADPSNTLLTYEDDKDYHGFIPRIEYSWIQDAGLSWVIDYSLLYKEYDNKNVVNSSTGILSSRDQEDYIHELNLDLWYFFEDIAGGLKTGVDLGLRMYESNQNYLTFTSVTDFEVNEDFFDYTSYRINPNVAYTFALLPLTASLSYSYEFLDYSDRWANMANGISRKNDEQWEVYHGITIGLQLDLTEKLSLMAQWDQIKARSNNDNENLYEYDYRVNTYLIGAKYDF